MARDFPIRADLQRLGVPERTIRVLEKAAQLTQIIQDAEDLASAVTVITEEQEDQNLSLTTLDGRLDAIEVLQPFVRQDQTTAWVDASGTLSRATFATYAGQVVSNPPTQVEVQAIDDYVKLLSQRVAALVNDLHAIGALT